MAACLYEDGMAFSDFSPLILTPSDQPIRGAGNIWTLIAMLGLGFAWSAAQRSEAGWTRQILAPLLLATVMLLFYGLSFLFTGADFALSAIISVIFLIGAILPIWRGAARMQSIRMMGGSPPKSLADALTGLLSGWLAVLVATTIPQIIRAYSNIGTTDFPWPLLWSALIPLFILTYIFTRFISNSLWYYAALIWGLGAIALNNWLITGTHWLGHIVAVLAIIILYLRLTRGAKGDTPF